MKRSALLLGLVAILGTIMTICPAATPTIVTPTITPSIITAGTSALVTITVQISDPNLIAGSVNLISLSPTGTQSTILGQFHDDGKNGDQLAGDNVYSIQYPFSESFPGQLQLEVSAAFKGQLKRIISPPVTLNIWGILVDQGSGLQVLYPPGVYDATGSTLLVGSTGASSIPGLFLLSSSPLGVNDGATGPDPTLSPTGYNIRIITAPYSGTFNASQWLASEYPDRGASNLTPVSIGGAAGYEFFFTDGEGSSWPWVLIFHGAETYLITYSSTFTANSLADQAGLNIFSQVLDNITFLN